MNSLARGGHELKLKKGLNLSLCLCFIIQAEGPQVALLN